MKKIITSNTPSPFRANVKSLFLTFLAVSFSLAVQAQDGFVTTWRTTSADESITIPTVSGLTYNYSVDWDNDGTPDDTGVTGDASHTYSTPGVHTITISGTFPRIQLGTLVAELDFLDEPTGDFILTPTTAAGQIRSVVQWGNIAWSSMELAFAGCDSLTIPDAGTSSPNLSNMSSMRYMFAGKPIDPEDSDFVRSVLNDANLGAWSVGSVTDMSSMFSDVSFDGDISNWNVSSVTDMNNMFSGSPFNQDISRWNVSSVTDMAFMFESDTSFNQNIGSWNVSSVTDMNNMFSGSPFNQDISRWNVSSVTDMNNMFSGSPFNQNIGSWNVSSVTDMNNMFSESLFNQNISSWNVSSVTNMAFMFAESPFNQPVSTWDVSSVTNMAFMFERSPFDQDISSWDVSSVTNMPNIFAGSPFNQDISEWDVSKVTNMAFMFAGSPFDQDISSWNVSSVTNMANMFFFSTTFNQDIGEWNVSSVTNMAFMFEESAAFDQDISDWDVSNVEIMIGMFQNASSFNQDIGNWNVSGVIIMRLMFSGASSFNQDIGNWNVSGVTDMASMFAESAFNQDISGWNVSSVTDMGSMFAASPFNQNIGNWNVSGVTDMAFMFSGLFDDDNMIVRRSAFNQDIGDWDISSVVPVSPEPEFPGLGMVGMFAGSSMSSQNYDSLLVGWSTLNTDAGETGIPTDVLFGAPPSYTCIGAKGRRNLIDNFGWTFVRDRNSEADNAAPVPGDNLEDFPSTSSVDQSDLIVPTAEDACEGAIQGVPSVSGGFPIESSAEVTWTYTDAAGNTATQTQQVTITSGSLPTVSLSVSNSGAITEGGTALTITATRSEMNTSGDTLFIPIGVKQAGTTTDIADHTEVASFIGIPDGMSTGTTSFEATTDNDDELEETIVIELRTSLSQQGTPSEVTITITDNDPTTVELQVLTDDDRELREGTNDQATLRLLLGRALRAGEVLGVPLSFSGGTLDTDFALSFTSTTSVALSGSTVTFTGSDSGSDMFADVVLTASEDDDTTDETVTVSIPSSSSSGTTRLMATNLDGGAEGSLTGDGQITLLDNDVPNSAPTVENAIPNQTATVGTAFSFQFNANTFSDADSDDLDYSATLSDDSVLPTWLSFDTNNRTLSGTPQAGDAGTISIKVTADDSNGGMVSDNFDLTVNAQPVVTITAGSPVTEGMAATFTINATPAPSANLTVNLTVAEAGGSNFVAAENEGDTTVMILASSSSVTYPVTTVDDNTDEPNNSVTVTLAGGTGYTLGTSSNASVTVNDNDDPTGAVMVSLSVSSSGAITEGGTALTITATRSEANNSGTALSIPIQVKAAGTTAEAGDYTVAASISIMDGSSRGITTFRATDDSTDEPEEKVVIELGTLTGGDEEGIIPEVTITITDNDPTTVVLTVTDSVTTEGSGRNDDTAMLRLELGRALLAGEKLEVPLFAPTNSISGPGGFRLFLSGSPKGVALNPNFRSVIFTGADGGSATIADVLGSFPSDTDDADNQAIASIPSTSSPDRLTLTDTNLGGGAIGSIVGNNVITIKDKDRRPAKPMNFMAVAVDREVTLSWDDPQNSEITIYQFQQKEGSRDYSDWMDISSSDATTTSHTITGLTNDTTYRFLIRANAVLSGATSDTVTATPMAGGTNSSPILLRAIPNGTAMVGMAYSYQVPANTFSDADNDPLEYSAARNDNSPLPDWLDFDDATRTFSGTPEAEDVGTVRVRVTVNDGNGGSESDVFNIAVSPVTPVITIVAGTSPVDEGTGATFTVTATPAPSANLTVSLTVAEATGSDFVAAEDKGDTTVTISAASSSVTYTVATVNDNTNEENGSVTVTVVDGNGYTVGDPASAMVTVNDDEALLSSTDDVTEVVIVPNPSNGYVEVRSSETSGTAKGDVFKILSLSGKLLLEGTVNTRTDVASLSSGMYLVQLPDGRLLKFIRE